MSERYIKEAYIVLEAALEPEEWSKLKNERPTK